MKRSLTLLKLSLILASAINAQNKVADKFGKGITALGKDSTFFIKAHTRIQSRYDYERNKNNSDNPQVQDAAFVRRARIKFGGWVLKERVAFKIEHDVLNGETYDAVVKFRPFANHKKFEIWAGQTKLPGNRERVISSQCLQFVDRSILNSNFTLDRDAGIQIRNTHKVGGVVIKEMIAISQGEGLNDKTKRPMGHEYTGRVEILPFGNFTSKGDYVASDLKREQTPKFALGLTYDFNEWQSNSRKVKGTNLGVSRNVLSFQADFMFKYKGISVMGEYANTDVDGERNYSKGSFYAGEGVNIQGGYLFNNNFEPAFRYSLYSPFRNVNHSIVKEYTFGLSKYIVGHNLKIQSDITLQQTEAANMTWINDLVYRLQVELAF